MTLAVELNIKITILSLLCKGRVQFQNRYNFERVIYYYLSTSEKYSSHVFQVYAKIKPCLYCFCFEYLLHKL